ncbi:GNAT family N-acetyltransferase [Actinomadura parmotrematis]|uniref:GNAT family N-acetyltransferase n=1 Tax=Actinomadura parmotrematis TaxID=2864039 RepID=A0ABS7FM09_9ACTN|nr:GNAT family N-acetyltransferase [Actinomadura parmotrematis]MBW8481417.1 GNAT family N-acetyltransferase [Actinomadura parmotrematis]
MDHRAVRSPLFCDVALAERVERAEVELIAASAEAARSRRGVAEGFTIPVAGGVASFIEADSPLNKVAGLGFAGSPSAAELDEVEHAFAARGAAVQAEIATLADPALGGLLADRGYRLVGFESVLGLALGDYEAGPAPDGVEVRPSGDGEFDAWLDVVAGAVLHPDVQGVPAHEDFPRDVLVSAMRDMAGAGVRRFAALRGATLAGGASMRTAGGVAQLTGAATTPEHRRHGVQTALLAARLADAAASGCDIAVVTTQPGSRSQQNVQRQGFDLLYTRAVLVKES